MCFPPWALLGKISLQLRWGGNGDANEQPHGGCKQRQLQVLSLSPSAHPWQYRGRARLPPVLGATERRLRKPSDQPAPPSGEGTPETGTQRTKIPTRAAGKSCALLPVPGSSRARPAGALSWRSAAGRSRSAPGLATSSFTAETCVCVCARQG